MTTQEQSAGLWEQKKNQDDKTQDTYCQEKLSQNYKDNGFLSPKAAFWNQISTQINSLVYTKVHRLHTCTHHDSFLFKRYLKYESNISLSKTRGKSWPWSIIIFLLKTFSHVSAVHTFLVPSREKSVPQAHCWIQPGLLNISLCFFTHRIPGWKGPEGSCGPTYLGKAWSRLCQLLAVKPI